MQPAYLFSIRDGEENKEMSISSRRSDDEHIVDYLKRKQAENPSFFYAVDDDGNLLWVDSSFRMNYSYFGDTVTLEKVHHNLISITGLNHHGHPVLFGCGLLLHCESESAYYVWLLQNWLLAMSGNYPVSITTEPDDRIRMAVAQVLPQTRHRFCRWSIFRETHEKLAKTHPTFDKEFRKLIQTVVTVEELESCWQALAERHFLQDNEWLQSIYNARIHWVPVYMQDTFFGELYPLNTTFFHGYITTSSMQSLVEQYERAVTSWQEMERKADFETANTMPALKTPSPMEKQAASMYTRRAFSKFQEELVETLANLATKVVEEEEVTTYRVAKFGDDEQQYVVRFNPFEMKAVCTCRMFERSGIICRHALSVFRAQNVLTLPSQYILKRWSRDARRGVVEGYVQQQQQQQHQDSLTARYNNLRKEAIKFVEEGAKSIHVYNVAQDALRVAANKLATSKKQPLILNPEIDPSPYQSEIGDEKEKKIRELTGELLKTNERCQVYRSNLLAVLREMEEQKLKLSVKMQNAKLTLKQNSGM